MKLDRENMKRILLLTVCGLLVFFGLYRFSTLIAVAQWAIRLLKPLLLGVCIAFVVNVLLSPLERAWDKIPRKKKNRWLSKLKRPVCMVASLLIIFGVASLVGLLVVPELQRTVLELIDAIPDLMGHLDEGWQQLRESLAIYSIELSALTFSWAELGKNLADFLTEEGAALLGTTVEITGSIVGLVVDGFLGLIFALYILANKERLGNQARKSLWALLPEKQVRTVLDVAHLTYETFRKFVTGQVVEAVIIGLLCLVGMLIFSFPFAPVIATLVGFSALVPVFGAFIGAGVGALLILTVDPLKAVGFVVFLVILQQLEGNLIYPKVVGKSVGLPGLWVLAAVTVGGSAFGLPGMLVSVPVCSVLYALFRAFVYRRLKEKKINPNKL